MNGESMMKNRMKISQLLSLHSHRKHHILLITSLSRYHEMCKHIWVSFFLDKEKIANLSFTIDIVGIKWRLSAIWLLMLVNIDMAFSNKKIHLTVIVLLGVIFFWFF